MQSIKHRERKGAREILTTIKMKCKFCKGEMEYSLKDYGLLQLNVKGEYFRIPIIDSDTLELAIQALNIISKQLGYNVIGIKKEKEKSS